MYTLKTYIKVRVDTDDDEMIWTTVLGCAVLDWTGDS